MEKKVLTHEDLRPGMKVRNTISGNIGVVRADRNDPEEIAMAGKFYAPIHIRYGPKQVLHKAYWALENVEIVEE